MKKIISLILAVAIILTLTSCEGGRARYTFKYQSGTSDYSSEMYYKDSLFDHDADVYDPSLATASLSLAMASFASIEEKDYANRSRNAKDLLAKLGFKDIEPNDFFKEKPGTDSLGCVFGHKTINGREMIVCGIRGGNYESEWASNFTIGAGIEGRYHQGFFEGSTIFLESLKKYISDTGIRGDVSLWMVGYSRGGAVCNISAGRIDEAISKGEAMLGSGLNISKKNVYAYCFEAPQGVYYDDERYPKSEIFNNIFCIINSNDVVPKMAMKELDFTRFGVDKYLFDNRNDINYEANIRKMEKFFNSFENSEALGGYSVGSFEMKRFSGKKISPSQEYFNWSQGIYLDDLLSHFTEYGIESREKYTENMQAGMREIFRYIYSTGSPSASLIDLGISVAKNALITSSTDLLLDDILHNQTKFAVDFKIVLMKALEMLNVDVGTAEIEQAVEELLVSMTKSLAHDFEFAMIIPFISESNMKGVAQAHRPELTLAFLRSLDPTYTKDPAEYDMSGRYICVEIRDTKANVTVSSGGSALAVFEEGKPVETGSCVPYGRHRMLRVYLPCGAEYTLATSSDKISIQVYDPSNLRYTDCVYTVSPDGSTYTFTDR